MYLWDTNTQIRTTILQVRVIFYFASIDRRKPTETHAYIQRPNDTTFVLKLKSRFRSWKLPGLKRGTAAQLATSDFEPKRVSTPEPSRRDTIACNMFDVRGLFEFIKPLYGIRATPAGYRIWACHTKGPSGQSNRRRRTRHCCFFFFVFGVARTTMDDASSCRPRSTQHTNFRHAKQTKHKLSWTELCRACRGVINTWTVRPVVREIRYPMQARTQPGRGVAQSELIKWCEKWAGKAEVKQFLVGDSPMLMDW